MTCCYSCVLHTDSVLLCSDPRIDLSDWRNCPLAVSVIEKVHKGPQGQCQSSPRHCLYGVDIPAPREPLVSSQIEHVINILNTSRTSKNFSFLICVQPWLMEFAVGVLWKRSPYVSISRNWERFWCLLACLHLCGPRQLCAKFLARKEDANPKLSKC